MEVVAYRIGEVVECYSQRSAICESTRAHLRAGGKQAMSPTAMMMTETSPYVEGVSQQLDPVGILRFVQTPQGDAVSAAINQRVSGPKDLAGSTITNGAILIASFGFDSR